MVITIDKNRELEYLKAKIENFKKWLEDNMEENDTCFISRETSARYAESNYIYNKFKEEFNYQ